MSSGISAQIQSRIIDPAREYNDTHKYQSFETDIMAAQKIIGDYSKYEIGLVSPINGKSVEMVIFDDNLYDIRSAQFAVESYYTQQLQRQYQHFQTNRTKYHVQPGLKFTLYTSTMIVDGGTTATSTTTTVSPSASRMERFAMVHWDCNYFAKQINQKVSPVTTGYSDNFAGLSTALDSSPLNKNFYVEWFGYFTPLETGLYGFSISTGNGGGVYKQNAPPPELGLVWVGDVALVNYNIDNSLTSNSLDKRMMTKDNIYPIRIHYGSGNIQASANQLSIDITLNGQPLSHGTGQLMSLMENTSYKTPYEPIQIHYALVNTANTVTTNDATTLYHVYITKYDILNNYRFNQQLRLAKTNTNYEYRQIGLVNIDTTDSVCTFGFQPNGELVLKNQNGRTAKLTSVAANVMGDDVFLELRGGNLYIMKGTTEPAVQVWDLLSDTQISDSNKSSFRQNYADAVVNTTWASRYNIAFNQNIYAARMAASEILDGTNALYSSDGKIVLYVKEYGLYLMTSHFPSGQRFHTTAAEKLTKKYYLLSANGDTKLGSQMLVNQTSKELQFVPMGGNILNYLDEFVAYSGDYSFPPNVTNRAQNYTQRDNMTPEDCRKKCTQNPKCGHYYTYETNEGNAHCIINTNNDTPLYLPSNPNLSVKPFSSGSTTNSSAPTLYKRKKNIQSQCKMDVYDVKYDSPNVPIAADVYHSYDNYSMNYNPYNPTPDKEGPCGDINIAKSIQLFKTGKETFVSGYNSTPCQSLSGPQCVQDIQNNINAVNRAFYTKQADNTEVQHKYDELTNLIHTKFEKQYNKINGNPLYDAIDNDGKLAHAEKSRHSLLNGMIEDVKDTMIRQNTYYIMANIFTAIFLVGLFSFVPDSS